MNIATQLLLVFAIGCASQNVTTNDNTIWKHGFSGCMNDMRTLYFYTDEPQTCDKTNQISRPPIYNLSCDIRCERGFFLDVNLSTPVPESACKKCPQGQYSVGGGELYSQVAHSWITPLPNDLHTECLLRDSLTASWDPGCNEWTASVDGSSINSGDNSDMVEKHFASRLVSLLRLSKTLVRDGIITYQYKVDAEEPYDGLLFVIDTTTVMHLESQSNGWKEFSANITAGTHTFTWQFVKDYTGNKGADKAWLKSIVIEGTSFSDAHCHPCAADMIERGDSVCRFCNQNQYAAPSSTSTLDLVCHDCPEHTYSESGSIGESSCVARRPCQESDYNVKYTDCQQGKRASTYFWTEPQTCSNDMEGAVSLPAAKDSLPCGNCTEGYYSGNDGNCLSCEGDSYLPPGATACQKCPAGQYPYRVLHYGAGTVDGWSKWPSEIDQDVATQNKWKLSHDSIVLENLGEQKSEWSSYKLPISVTYASSGKFHFQYALSNLAQSSDDVHIYLELYLDDVLVPMTSGHLAGSHNETVTVALSGSHKFEFNLVCKGHLPGNPAKAEIIHFSFEGSSVGGATKCSQCTSGSIVSTDQTGCTSCPAGSHGGDGKTCEKCPEHTYSEEADEKCTPCGDNMISSAGATVCAAPSMLSVKYSGNVDLKTVAYDLGDIQDLALEANFTGKVNISNEDSLDDLFSDELSTDLLTVTTVFQANASDHYAFGIFRKAFPKLGSGSHITQPGADPNGNYLMKLQVNNVKEAGGTFPTVAQGFGQVQCNVPTIYGYRNIGSRIASIIGASNGTGISITYVDGDVCDTASGERHTSVVNFVCDSGVEKTTELKVVESGCKTTINWRTNRGCPICTPALVTESRSECDGGNQTVSMKSSIPCNGDDSMWQTKSFVRTCTSVVLDDQTIYKLYAVMVGVTCLLLFLVVFVLVVHKKYTKAQEEAKYLKGQLTRTRTKAGDETVFEFASDDSNRIADTPMQTGKASDRKDDIFGQESDSDEEEDIDIQLCSSTDPKSDDLVQSSDEEGEPAEFV